MPVNLSHDSIGLDYDSFDRGGRREKHMQNSWIVYVKGLLWMLLFLLPAIFALMSVESITDSMQKHQKSLDSGIQEAYSTVNAMHYGPEFGPDETTVAMLVEAVHGNQSTLINSLTNSTLNTPLPVVPSTSTPTPYGHVLLKDLQHPAAPSTVKNASLGIFISGLALLVVNIVCWILCLTLYGRKGNYLHPALGNAAWGRHVFTSIFITISFAFVNSSSERMFATGAVMAFVAAISVLEACACFCDSLRPFTDDFLHDQVVEKKAAADNGGTF